MAFRLFWYSLCIALPNLAYELASFSQLYRHQDRHKILNDDVTNILDIKFLFFKKKICGLKDFNERNLMPKTRDNQGKRVNPPYRSST